MILSYNLSQGGLGGILFFDQLFGTTKNPAANCQLVSVLENWGLHISLCGWFLRFISNKSSAKYKRCEISEISNQLLVFLQQQFIFDDFLKVWILNFGNCWPHTETHTAEETPCTLCHTFPLIVSLSRFLYLSRHTFFSLHNVSHLIVSLSRFLYLSRHAFFSLHTVSHFPFNCVLVTFSLLITSRFLLQLNGLTDLHRGRFSRRWEGDHHSLVRSNGSRGIYWLWQVRRAGKTWSGQYIIFSPKLISTYHLLSFSTDCAKSA